ncbi:MAG: TonB-dependent receptor [Ferruginibacter sp.]|nr:TonB-dependent receptor [Ferruginibacter sp.]
MRAGLPRITIVFILIFSAYCKNVNAQLVLNKPVNISVEQMEIKKVFAFLRKQTGVKFTYSTDIIDVKSRVTCKMGDALLSEVLDAIFKPLRISYRVIDDEQLVLFINSTALFDPLTKQPDPKMGAIEAGKEKLINGSVKNEKGIPLPGVTIIEKGTGQITVSDDKGNFSLNVTSESAVLLLTYIGYTTLEYKTGKLSFLNLAMRTSLKELEDVIVVGYGTQRKATNTGAQSSIIGKLLLQSPAANVSNSLVGRLSGLFASQAGGEPGNDYSTLRIRGVGTFNGSQEPLILVDGIQVDNFNSIDPNEIENITILKDASSTAVYGIRGANGVLIITTKRGQLGPAKAGYSFNQAVNSFTNIRSQMNSYDYANSFNQALKNDSYITGGLYIPRYSQQDLEKYKSGEDPVFYPNIDWYKVMLKKTSRQQLHNLNINGGTEKLRYSVSTGYFNQEGLFNNTKLSPGYDAQIRFKRFNFRSNLNFTLNKRFKAAVDISSQTEIRTGNAGNTLNVIDNIARANPTVSPGIVDGKLINLTTTGGNPLVSLYQAGYQREYRNYLNGSFRLEHDLDFITEGLSTHAVVAYQNYNSQRLHNYKPSPTVISYIPLRQADGRIVYLPQNEDGQFIHVETISKSRRVTSEFALDYKRNFGNHHVSGLLLYNQLKSTDPTFSFGVPNGYQSYVGRGSYNFRGRYLAEINVAYNGTENFAPGNRFGFFPAYSIGWITSEESFFPADGFMGLLKFRASYGEVGNDQVGSGFLYSNNRFLFRSTAWTYAGGYNFGEVSSSYNLLTGSREGRSGNPNLTWERSVKSNLGIEMSFWKRKISLSVDLFSESRDNILANQQTVSGVIGVAIPPLNIGKMQNKGFEFDFSLNDNIGELNYQVKANYSFARNRILFQDEITRRYPYQFRTGNRFGQYFGLVNEGFYNSWDEVNDPKRPVYEWQNNKIQPGDLRFKDVNNDGKINNDDQVPIGYSQVPEKTFGISLAGQYKGFSFSVLFQGVGNVSLNYTRRFTQAFFDAVPAGAVDYLINSWTPERYASGATIQFPRFSLGTNGGAVNNYQPSDFFTVDASYVRLKNAEIGYALNKSALKKIGLSATRIFINGNNLFTWSKMYKGADPESPPTAENTEPYPLVRTVNMGISIQF